MNINQINPFIPIPKLKFNDPCKVVAKFLTFVDVLRFCSTHREGQLWASVELEKRLPKVYTKPSGMLFDIFKREVALLQGCKFDMRMASNNDPIKVQIKPSVLINAVDRPVNQQEREQLSALLGTAIQHHADICVRLMIDRGVDVNTPSENNEYDRRRYPLIEAADRNDNEMVRLLLRSKADPKVFAGNPKGWGVSTTALLLALRGKDNCEMVSDLLDAGMQVTDEIRTNDESNYLDNIRSVDVLLVVHDKQSRSNLDSYQALLKKTNRYGKTRVECWQRFLISNDPRLEALKRDLQNWGIL